MCWSRSEWELWQAAREQEAEPREEPQPHRLEDEQREPEVVPEPERELVEV